MNTEFFIARRISSKQGGPRNVMVRIAAATAATSIAVMIITLAVIFGFKSGITEKLTGFGGHVEIVNLDGNTSFETTPIKRNPQLEEGLAAITGLRSYYLYAVKGGIIKTEEATQGVMLKGMDSRYDWSFFGSALEEGGLPAISDTMRTTGILISRSLSQLMKLGVGDKVEMLFVQSDRPPRRYPFKVSGIYNTGLEEMDRVVIPTSLRNVQHLNGWSADQITGYEVYASDFSHLDQLWREVRDLIYSIDIPEGNGMMARSIRERYVSLFDWLNAHNVNAAVIITIMLLVALLNMVSALLIILLERTRMIGILKSLGMNNGAIRKIFLLRSGFILLKGMLWGNIVGIGLCLVQYWTHAVKLDEASYFLAAVPIEIDPWWIIALNVGVFTILSLLLAIPTTIVSRIRPEKTIRYQ